MENIENTNLIPPSPNIDIKTLSPFTRFCCTIGNIPASYLVAMSYEEQLLWLCNFLEKTVIPTINNNGEAVTELQKLFIQFTNDLSNKQENFEINITKLFEELKSFVNNYFDNLDVQQEINNKLDQMLQDGTFQNLLSKYFVGTLLNAKSINFTEGDIFFTTGYNTPDDGGNGYYLVSSNGSNNDGTCIELNNGLFANLLTNDITVNHFGAFHNNINDDTPFMQKMADTLGYIQLDNYNYLGEIGENELLAKSSLSPSSLIIVNTRKAARKLYKKISGKKYHLSTYMTALDRAIILKNIRKELKCLEKEFPDFKNVPEERQITIVSTSLIEAGVDLDVYTVFRELKGLDNILQAGGRCNREGKRKRADVFVFELLDSKKKAISVEMDITRDLLKKYEDISDSTCIKEYYERIFSLKEASISQNTMHCMCDDFRYIPFKEYAKNFELIDSRTVSLVIPRDEKSRRMVADLKYKQTANERNLQNYTCSLYKNELDDLIKQNVVDDFGTGIYCLTNLDYYDEEIGLLFEARDYLL